VLRGGSYLAIPADFLGELGGKKIFNAENAKDSLSSQRNSRK